MQRTVSIARTAYDLNHVNRLGVPGFAVVDLRLAGSGKTSRFHQPADAPPPKNADSGTEDFHFAPEHETIELRYEIADPFLLVDGAKLDLFTRFEKDPLWSLDLATLGPDWYAHGKHTVKWDGRIVQPTKAQTGTRTEEGLTHDLTTLDVDKNLNPFPDGYVTLEHTPYKFRLTLTSTTAAEVGSPHFGWTFYHILVKSLELELGPEETVPAQTVDDDEHKRNKSVRAHIRADGGLPAAGAADARKVTLVSNLNKIDVAEMDDNTAFEVYKALWGNGPKIPLIAKVRLLTSADAELKVDESEKGAVALGRVKFLWDWEDPAEDVSGMQTQAAPRAFIGTSIDYYKDGTDASRSADDHTYPKGDNCHVDRGGKRGPASAPIFPAQAGYAPKKTLDVGQFPFKVEAPPAIPPAPPAPAPVVNPAGATKERAWAALSEGWTSGALKGKTGVVFQPSRMAGDDYIVSVYLAYDKSDKDKLTLNVNDEPLVAPAAIKASTGKLQVWRQIELVRYIRKKNAIADFVTANLAAIRQHYREPYIAVENNIQAANKYELPTAGYNGVVAPILTALGDEIVDLAAPPGTDHAASPSTFQVRDFAAFCTAVPGHLASLGLPSAPADVTNWLTLRHVETNLKYARYLKNVLQTPATQVVDGLDCLKGAPDGITIVQFQYVDSYTAALIAAGQAVGTLNGAALDVPGRSRSRCCFALWRDAVDTFVHEIGHHLFLPHFGPQPTAFIASHHDSVDLACVMTYNRPRPRFCGLCQLRLRGWDLGWPLNTPGPHLLPVAANNKRP